MGVSPLAGKPAPQSILVNIPRLVSTYYSNHPDPSEKSQLVEFGTSGHRGSSLKNTFNEDHILAIAQAICEFRKANGISGPLFLGKDTHALSEPSFATAIEVLAANGVDILVQSDWGYTPTPVISHAILAHNSIPQPAGGWGFQVQPAGRRTRRHGDNHSDSDKGK
jgi:phosphoglucomutase